MDLNFALQFEPGDAPQILAKNFRLNLELMLIAGVLIVASAAAAEMWTRRFDAVRRRLYGGLGLRAREAGFFFRDDGFDLFSGENKGDEHGLAASAVFAGRFGRKASQSVAAVDELFNV